LTIWISRLFLFEKTSPGCLKGYGKPKPACQIQTRSDSSNAAVISAKVLMQLIPPGSPAIHTLLVSVMDPRSGNYIASLSEKYRIELLTDALPKDIQIELHSIMKAVEKQIAPG
jgi:hypothetical protein